MQDTDAAPSEHGKTKAARRRLYFQLTAKEFFMSKSYNRLIGFAVGAIACSFTFPGIAADKVHTNIRQVAVKHVIVETGKPYAAVCDFIESNLGQVDRPMMMMLKNGQIDQLKDATERITKNYGLSIISVSDHGKLLALNGPTENEKVYYIGNFVTASTMTRAVRAAGMYAPLRVVVYENASGGTTFEYDQPSSEFAQFDNKTTDSYGAELDGRIDKLVHDGAH